jgi:hypothetical protein
VVQKSLDPRDLAEKLVVSIFVCYTPLDKCSGVTDAWKTLAATRFV